MNTTLLIALAGAVLTPLLAYLAAARRLSGKISHSEASDLWAASEQLRTEYREQISKLEQRVDRLEDENKQLRGLEREVERLRQELDDVRHENEALKRTNEELRRRIAELERSNDAAKP